MRTMILASMRTYSRRYVSALFAVVIATAFIVSINALGSAAREGSGLAVQQQYGRADLVVPGLRVEKGLDDDIQQIAAVPGVSAVALDWLVYGTVALPDGRQDVRLGSLATSPALRWQQAATGRLPRTDDEVALSSSVAEKSHVSAGDTVTLELPQGDRRLKVTGTVDAIRGHLSAALYLPERSFAGLAERNDLGTPEDAVVAVDGNTSAVMAGIEQVTGAGSVDTGSAHREALRLQASNGIDVFQKLIYVFAGISMFVGALVIANTFTILLAQRARDLALLRCVGALRSQVARSVVVEGLLLGLVGSVLGVTIGFGIGAVGVTLIRHFSPDSPMGPASLTLWGVAIPIVLGVAITVAGSYLPALRAGTQSPLAALQPQDAVEPRTRSFTVRVVAASLLLVLGGAGLVTGLGGSLPASMAGGMLSFVGVLLLAPVLVPAAIRAVGPVARRLGIAGRLAHLNSLRNPRRTAATSTALLIGVTLITTVVVSSSSLSHKIVDKADTSKPIDLTVASTSAKIPDRVTEAVSRADGVKGVAALAGASGRVDGHEAEMLGVGPDALALVHAGSDFRRLGPDQIVVPWSMGEMASSRPGDTVTVTTGGTSRSMEVVRAGTIGDRVLVSSATLASMGARTEGTRALWVRASDSADPGSVVAEVTTIVEKSDLDVQGGLTERADVLHILHILLMVTVGLLAVAVLIALIGVANTLSLSVLERVRENSLLRAIGLDRSGLRRMLAIEALLMAGVSAVLGVGLGLVYAWFGIRSMSSGVFPTPATLIVPWGQIGLILVVAALSGLAACVLPARRAVRIAPAAGLVAD